MKKLVSIVIPAYSVDRFIRRCLTSILKQSYSDIEIIVVYDDSPDDTYKILEHYKDEIKLINVGRKTSPAIARNIGLAYSKGEYVSFLDGDDFIAPVKIEKQVNILDDCSEVGLVYTDFILVDEFDRELKGIRVPNWNRRRWLSRPFTLITSSLLIRKNVLDDIKENGCYFDESFLACEDFDLLIRLAKITGFKRIPYFLTYYTSHEGQLSDDLVKTIIMETKILMKHNLYSGVIRLSFFELAKLLLKKTFENPAIGFGLFHREGSPSK